jgi:tetraacyldisaccharide 4'-kinase
MRRLKPLSFLYKKIAGFKNYLYDHEYIHSLELPITVLSLGNLTLGGTGKTPLTDLCLRYFLRHRMKVAVVSRNYRAQVETMAKVDLHHPDAAAYFGDEPVLLAQRNPQVDFFVGPRKFETAQFAFEQVSPQLVIIDDGFQHRQLYRDIDLVILDATEPLENYQCIPEGRAREPWESLSRATAFVVTKVNLATPREVQELYERLAPFKKPIIPMNYELLRLRGNVPERLEKSLKECQGKNVFLVSAIAKPKSFERSLEKFAMKIQAHKVYTDHHPYSPQDVEDILAEYKKTGEGDIITTEKDYVKLKPLWPADVPLWYAPLEVQIQSQEDVFYEILDQALH